jgi:hypothetical protein
MRKKTGGGKEEEWRGKEDQFRPKEGERERKTHLLRSLMQVPLLQRRPRTLLRLELVKEDSVVLAIRDVLREVGDAVSRSLSAASLQVRDRKKKGETHRRPQFAAFKW